LPDYWYQALTGSGTVQEGWMTAPNEIVLEQHLRQQGSYLLKVEAKTRVKKFTDGNIDRRELLAMLEYVSGSFAAGIPLLGTLEDLPKRLRSAKFKTIIDEVRNSVSVEGKSFSEALAEHPKAFPQLYVATIQAGEASGQLAFALQQLVDYVDWQESIAGSIRQATMYPIIVILAVGLLVTGLVGFVFPRILPILRMRNVELPLPTRIIMNFSLFIHNYWLPVLILAGLLVFAYVILRRNEKGRLAIDGLFLRIPVIGQFILEVNMARVVTYLGLFYKSGVDLLQSLVLVEQLTTNRVIGGVVREARELIAGGSTIASAFGRSPLVPVIVMRSLALGEQTGRLDESLERAKMYYSREIPAGVRRVVTFIQPALIILLGGVVLLTALAIMLPILNIYNSIGVRR
jgi:type II secretory pathway component PulF